MSDRFAQILSFIIGFVFFWFYVLIVNSILAHDVLSFPYIILTIYFFISIFTFPMVSIETEDKTPSWEPLSSRYSLIFAYLVSPVWVIIKIFKNKE